MQEFFMEIIVHIGTEKTGTTTLQQLLHDNRNRLAESGFHFLKSPGLYNSRDLVAYCKRDYLFDDYFKGKRIETPEEKAVFREDFLNRFMAEIDALPINARAAVVSSEHFHSRLIHDDEVEALRTLLSRRFDKVRIVTYLRKQVDTAVSLYSTALISGHSIELLDFVEAECDPAKPYYNYYDYLKRWERAFGRDSMIVRIFEPAAFRNGNLIDDFLSLIDPALLASIDTNVVSRNESINHLGQCLLKSLNRHIPRYEERSSGINPRNVELSRLIIEGTRGRGIGLNEAHARTLQERFANSNEAVRREYFPNRETLFGLDSPKAGERQLSAENEAVLDRLISALSGSSTSDFSTQLLKELVEVRTNRDTLHDQLVVISGSYGAVLKDYHEVLKDYHKVAADFQFLRSKLVNRVLLKLRAKFGWR